MHVRHDMITCYVVRALAGSHEFLQLRRAAGDFLGGTWQAISGGIEPHETAWLAALRELKEEAGLTPLEFYRLPVVNTFYISEQDTLWHSVPFCAVVSAEATVRLNGEHDACRWIPRNDVAEAFMWATDRSAIAELCKTILDGGAAKPYLRIPIEAT
jgi:8-oxo-dGTP pyrophosphatase MutT (NUDIX family)